MTTQSLFEFGSRLLVLGGLQLSVVLRAFSNACFLTALPKRTKAGCLRPLRNREYLFRMRVEEQ